MLRLLILGGLCAGLSMGAGSLDAQTTATVRPLSAIEQSQWGAIGQISYGGATGEAICTGILVAPDLVLTAGHCVAIDSVPMQASIIQFAAGWRDGASLALRHGKAVILAQPDIGQPPPLAQDVALLVLDAPIGGEVTAPLPLSPQVQSMQNYSVIGYRRDAPEVAMLNNTCPLLATKPGVLRLGCPVVSGNSGAPLLVWQQNSWYVAAVIVARGGYTQAYAAIPGDELRAVIAAN